MRQTLNRGKADPKEVRAQQTVTAGIGFWKSSRATNLVWVRIWGIQPRQAQQPSCVSVEPCVMKTIFAKVHGHKVHPRKQTPFLPGIQLISLPVGRFFQRYLTSSLLKSLSWNESRLQCIDIQRLVKTLMPKNNSYLRH